MDTQTKKINILIVGATGTLGSLVTKHSLTKPNLLVNILVRDPQKNKELTSQVEKAGGRVIQGDITKSETLKGITKGMHTVIFTLPPFGENVTVDGQIAVINDAVENGVERIVPSEFGENSVDFSAEYVAKLAPMANKLKVREYLKTLPIKSLIVNQGLLIDSLFGIVVAKEFGYWGDADQKLDLTTYEDTARLVAAAVARKDLAGEIAFVANEMSISEVADVYNKVRGTDIKPKRYGSLEDLVRKVEELESQGDSSALLLRLFAFIFDPRSKFERNNTGDFPEVKRTSVEEFLRERPNIKISA